MKCCWQIKATFCTQRINGGNWLRSRSISRINKRIGISKILSTLIPRAQRDTEISIDQFFLTCFFTALNLFLFLSLLQDNQLHFLQDDLFSDLVNLTHLFLHGNRIRALSENVFRGLVNLDRLLLHDNRIRQVNRRAFRDLGRLTILYLFNNSLAELPGQAMKDTQGIQFLRLNGNPWSCGCEARPLWEWFREARISSSEVMCISPSKRRGQDLRFLRELDFALCPLPDPGSLAGSTTTTFSTKTRWWFSKHKPASSSKSSFQKSKETVKSFPFSGVKPQYLPKTPVETFPSKYELSADEAALPKLDQEEYWANYGNEDSSIRCYDTECSPGYENLPFPSSTSSAITPSFLHLFSLSIVVFGLHFLFGWNPLSSSPFYLLWFTPALSNSHKKPVSWFLTVTSLTLRRCYTDTGDRWGSRELSTSSRLQLGWCKAVQDFKDEVAAAYWFRL